MRARWQDLHARLSRSLDGPSARARWSEARARCCALARFADPAALVVYLHSKDGDLGEKDRIYVSLIEIVQARGEGADLALGWIWLGMWPALDSTYRRWIRSYAREPEALCSAISFHFTALVQRVDPSRVRRMAATLARSTRREVADECRRGHREISERAELREDARGILDAAEQTTALRAWLEDTLGDEDTELLVAVAGFGETQREAGERIGLRAAAAKKRFQRAVSRARRALQSTESSPLVSPSRLRFRISPPNQEGSSRAGEGPRHRDNNHPPEVMPCNESSLSFSSPARSRLAISNTSRATTAVRRARPPRRVRARTTASAST